MDKGYLCDGCGDREPVVYCEECKLHFCEECDAYLHSGKSSVAKMYASHARKSVSKEGGAKPSPSPAAEEVFSRNQEIDEAIQRVSAEYSELSAKSAQQSRDFLEQTLGTYLKALSQVKADTESVLHEAHARRDFLESLKASQSAPSHETYKSNYDDDDDDDDDDNENREALLSIARMRTTSSLEERLTAATKAIEGITSRYSKDMFPPLPNEAILAASTQRTLVALLSEDCSGAAAAAAKDAKDALLHDIRFFPADFRITLNFSVEHAFDAAGGAKLTWKAPELLLACLPAGESPLFLVELRDADDAWAPYRVCYSGDALSCGLGPLEPEKSYKARVTALRAPGERLPYVSMPHKIVVTKKSEAAAFRVTRKTFYQGCWTPGPAEGEWGYDLTGDGCAVLRNGKRAGDYLIGICGLELDMTPGVATAWTFEVEEIDAESHLYMGLCPMEAVVAAAGSDLGYYFCATCGALKMEGGEHVDVSDCPRGTVKKKSCVGFEFVSNGESGILVISVNRKTIKKRIEGIPLDIPLFPAIVCKAGKVRIIS